MTQDMFGLLVLGLGVALFYGGYLLGHWERRRQDRVLILGLEQRLMRAIAAETEHVAEPPPLVKPATPHVHSFTVEPQCARGAWNYWSCYTCKAEQARRKVAT